MLRRIMMCDTAWQDDAMLYRVTIFDLVPHHNIMSMIFDIIVSHHSTRDADPGLRGPVRACRVVDVRSDARITRHDIASYTAALHRITTCDFTPHRKLR